MLYQNRQVVFTPKFCHRRASISVKLNRSVSALRALPKLRCEDSCKVFGRPRFAVILRASHLAPMHASALTRRWEPGDAEPWMTRNVRYT
jgi:hypothetical protein